MPEWEQLYPDTPIKSFSALKNTCSHISKNISDDFTRYPREFRNFVSEVEKNVHKIILKGFFFINDLNLWISILQNLISVVMGFIVMQLMGINRSSNNRINLPLWEVLYFPLLERHSMPVKLNVKPLCLINLNSIHKSALSW